MMNTDDFLDRMEAEDDDRRSFAEFLDECRAEHSRLTAETKARAAEQREAIRVLVRQLADAGMSGKQIADAVDELRNG